MNNKIWYCDMVITILLMVNKFIGNNTNYYIELCRKITSTITRYMYNLVFVSEKRIACCQ